MVIDSHAHLWADCEGLDEVAESEVIEQVWLMEIPYYRESVYKDLASRSDTLEIAKRYPGFFIPFGCIDFMKGPEQIDEMKELGFEGIKAIRPPKPYDDPSYLPIYERVDALKMPIVFHVGIIARNKPEDMTPAQSLGPTNMRPSMLDGIAAAFPDLKVIAGHIGFPWQNELLETLYFYPNTYCTLCGYIDYQWLISHLDRRCATEDGTMETICDRMLFASDTCYGRKRHNDFTARFADFMEMFFQFVGRTYQWGEKAESFLIGNAQKVFQSSK